MKKSNFKWLKLASSLLIGASFTQAYAGVSDGSYEVIENGAGKFSIDLSSDDGVMVPLEGVTQINIDDILFDYDVVLDAPEGGKQDQYRKYRPGKPIYGNIEVSVCGSRNPVVDAWKTGQGKNIRKNVQIILRKRDGGEGRQYNLFDVFPISFSKSDSSGVTCETTVAKIGRVELASSSDNAGNVLDSGVYPLLTGTDVMDPPFSSWSGGEPAISQQLSTGSDQFHTTTPGHKSVGEITLRGPLTSGRKAMVDWMNSSVSGKSWRMMLTVKEIVKDGASGKKYNYLDCFPTRYVFPKFSSRNTGNLYEEVRIKPIRLELR